MAAIMSKEGRDRILSLTTSQAEKIIIAAYDDPKLYRSLLIGPTASQAAKEAAGKTIDFAVQQAVIIETTAAAINSNLISGEGE